MTTKLPAAYSISRMTGCVEGRVPAIALQEALESGLMVKAVDLRRKHPIYGVVISINYALDNFEIFTDEKKHTVLTLKMKDYVIFEIEDLDDGVPLKLGTAIICGEEIFTVINVKGNVVWVGDGNLVYYPEDIQAIIKNYGYSILMG